MADAQTPADVERRYRVASLPPVDPLYPDSDGKPMADNTRQFEWIVTIKGNLDRLFAERADVFVAGDLLWYAVEGQPKIRVAPDVMVAFGRPKGHRGSYKQWVEGGIAPQVVFEILSPSNRAGELLRKTNFYNRHGVEEYYIIDPDSTPHGLEGWRRRAGVWDELPEMNGHVSPRLGVRFELHPDGLRLFHPSGEPFASFGEIGRQRDQQQRRADQQQRRADQQQQRADQQQQRAERLAARLRELGIDPPQ